MTAKLPRIAVERPARAIGKDTLTAMQSGIYFGYVGLIEGIVSRIRRSSAARSRSLRPVASRPCSMAAHRCCSIWTRRSPRAA
jgi:pantothenate kinase type III